MKCFEFGSASDPVAVILLGGGASYRGAEPAARRLGERFHVVLVAYDGFNPSEPDTQFKSVMDEAQRLGDYMFLWYGIRGSVDRRLSANLDRLKATGTPFELTVFPDLGHGGLAGEYPARFVEEVAAAYQKSLN